MNPIYSEAAVVKRYFIKKFYWKIMLKFPCDF